jgi:hypothetical protein
VIVGRLDGQDADDLLEVIKDRIRSSSYAIFDASGENANVSLEYGYAEAIEIPRVLYVSTHRSAKRASSDSPIIADLAGKRQNHYKQERALRALLTTFSKKHSYTARFERFLVQSDGKSTRGNKKRNRARSFTALIARQMFGGQTLYSTFLPTNRTTPKPR